MNYLISTYIRILYILSILLLFSVPKSNVHSRSLWMCFSGRLVLCGTAIENVRDVCYDLKFEHLETSPGANGRVIRARQHAFFNENHAFAGGQNGFFVICFVFIRKCLLCVCMYIYICIWFEKCRTRSFDVRSSFVYNSYRYMIWTERVVERGDQTPRTSS